MAKIFYSAHGEALPLSRSVFVVLTSAANTDCKVACLPHIQLVLAVIGAVMNTRSKPVTPNRA